VASLASCASSTAGPAGSSHPYSGPVSWRLLHDSTDLGPARDADTSLVVALRGSGQPVRLLTWAHGRG
jgi:hypothetical protein